LQIDPVIVSSVSAIAATFGLVFLGIQIWDARKTSDFQALVEFDRHIDDRERAFLAAVRNDSSEGIADEAYHSLLNLLEVYAAAQNRRLMRKTTAEFVRDRLLDAHVLIEESPYWRDKREKARLNSATFSEWDHFVDCHKSEIAERRQELR
jgi:hypothetical protein